MSAPTIKQATALSASGTVQTASTLQLPVWPGTTTTGNRNVVVLGITNNAVDGITATCSDGTAYTETLNVRRQASGHDAETLYVWQRLNITGSTTRPTITFTGLPGAGVYVTAVAYEVVGSHTTTEVDIAAASFVGSGTAFPIGPSGPTVRGDVLWLGGVATPNIQALTINAGNAFSQVTAGASSGTGDSTKSHLLVATAAQTSIGSAELDVTVTGGFTRQYAGGLVAIPGTSSLPGGGTGGGSPRSFPLGPPDTTGYTHIPDLDPTTMWAPKLTNGTDYVLDCPVRRTHGIRVIGGGNVVIPKLLIKLSGHVSEMIAYGGGDPGRILHIDTFDLDPNGFDCDAIQTQSPCTGRHIQLRTGFIRKLIGSTNPSTISPSGVHADLLQSSGGIGEVWVQDVEAVTTYQGFQLQREAKLGPGTAKSATGWTTSSGLTKTVNASAHGLTAGMYVSHSGFSDLAMNGGHTVATASANSYTVLLAINPSASSGGAGTIQQMSFGYDVDGWHCLRYHMVGAANASGDPSNALGAFRIGARTAPVSNSHPNEDGTRITDDAWNGSADFTDVYIEPPGGTSAGVFVEPDTGSTTWSVVKPVLNTVPTPDEITYPNWSKVTGTIYVGAPASPFVVYQAGVPVSTFSGGGGSTPAPVNTSLPTITPADPQAGTVLNWTVGAWNDTDAATTYTIIIQRRLGTSGGYSTVQTTVQVGAAPGTYTTSPSTDAGYQFRVNVTANNGTAGTPANSTPTNVLLENSPITLTAVIE